MTAKQIAHMLWYIMDGVDANKTALADGIVFGDQDSVPVVGNFTVSNITDMAYFTPAELPNNKYYIFGKDGAKNLAQDLDTTLLGEVPLVQSIREAGDVGHPVALQEDTALELAFIDITKNMLSQLVKRNEDLPPTEIVRITTMSGCGTK